MKVLQILLTGMFLLAFIIIMPAGANAGTLPTQLITVSGNETSMNMSVTDMAANGLMNVTRAVVANNTTDKTTYVVIGVAENQPELDDYQAIRETYKSGSKDYQKAHRLNFKKTEGSTKIGIFTVKWLVKTHNGTVLSEMITMSFARNGLQKEYKKSSLATYAILSLA